MREKCAKHTGEMRLKEIIYTHGEEYFACVHIRWHADVNFHKQFKFIQQLFFLSCNFFFNETLQRICAQVINLTRGICHFFNWWIFSLRVKSAAWFRRVHRRASICVGDLWPRTRFFFCYFPKINKKNLMTRAWVMKPQPGKKMLLLWRLNQSFIKRL